MLRSQSILFQNVKQNQFKNIWEQFSKNVDKTPKIIQEEQEFEIIDKDNLCFMENRDYCSLCNNQLELDSSGFQICSSQSCGMIFKNHLDHGAEWRFYGNDDNNSNTDPSRCGMPTNPLLKESSFGCSISYAPRMSWEMKKIKRYTEWQSMPYKEKSQYEEFQHIIIMAHNAGIPKIIIDDAMRIHKQISDIKTFRGINRDGIIAASIYVACRMNGNPRTAKEIATMFVLDNTSATRGCKNATNILNEAECELNNNEKTDFCDSNPLIFIDRFTSKLNMNRELTMLCKFMADKIEKQSLIPENTPHAIAAGIIYYVASICNLNINKKDVHIVTEMSEVTINKCYKKIEKLKDELIPKQILEKYGNS